MIIENKIYQQNWIKDLSNESDLRNYLNDLIDHVARHIIENSAFDEAIQDVRCAKNFIQCTQIKDCSESFISILKLREHFFDGLILALEGSKENPQTSTASLDKKTYCTIASMYEKNPHRALQLFKKFAPPLLRSDVKIFLPEEDYIKPVYELFLALEMLRSACLFQKNRGPECTDS